MAFLGRNKNCGHLVGSCIRQGGEEDPGIREAPRTFSAVSDFVQSQGDQSCIPCKPCIINNMAQS